MIKLIGYDWLTNEDTGKKSMVVRYLLDDREKTIPLRKLGTLIEACLREGPVTQPANTLPGFEPENGTRTATLLGN